MDWFFFRSKPTPEEVTAAAPSRTAFRTKVLADVEQFSKVETNLLAAGGLEKEEKIPYKEFIQETLAWINANIEVSREQIFVKETSYDEKLPFLREEFQNSLNEKLLTLEPAAAKKLLQSLPQDQSFPNRKELEETLKNKESQKTQKDQKEAQDLENRGWMDDISDAMGTVGKIIGVLAYLIVSIRVAAFSANSMLHKLPAYRILAFAYGFLFSPFLFFYYLYKEIFGPTPRFESILPLYPYTINPGESIPFFYTAFGYNDTAALKAELAALQQQETQSALDYLKNSTLYADLLSAKGIQQ